MTVSERIKELRKRRNYTADHVAEKLGVSRSTIFRYENGDIEKVPADIIDKLAGILDTNPSYLLGWTDDPWENWPHEDGPEKIAATRKMKIESPVLHDAYFSFAEDAREQGIDPEDIKTALAMIKKLRGDGE